MNKDRHGISAHFKREAKLMLCVSLLPIALGLAVVLLWPILSIWIE